jgi:chemotaxis protein MotB
MLLINTRNQYDYKNIKSTIMLRTSTIICMVLIAGIFLSCSSAKELKAAQAQIEELQAENTAVSQDMKKQVGDLTARNQSLTDEYSRYKANCTATEKKLKHTEEEFGEMQSALVDFANSVGALQLKLDSALIDFQNQGVEVYTKDRVVYVSMEDKLLYKSGSAVMSADGKKALGHVAAVLNQYPDLKVIVVGNTDNVQFKSGKSDNWTLSTERANGVVRLLRDSYEMDPARLTSAGKGKYNPVADNDTPEGRAKNRRTDIVLNPDLMKLWKSIRNE